MFDFKHIFKLAHIMGEKRQRGDAHIKTETIELLNMV